MKKSHPITIDGPYRRPLPGNGWRWWLVSLLIFLGGAGVAYLLR